MDGEYFRVELNDSEFVSAIAWSSDKATVRIGAEHGLASFTKEQLVETIQMLNSVLEKVNNYE